MLIILFVAFFLNQGDRAIYNAVLPLIKVDLRLSDVELGLVVTVFTLLYGVLVPLAGCLGDFVSKKWIICFSLLTFSTGTLLTGLSSGLLMLILFRGIATGIGEACYYPSANSLIGQYHRDTRAQAMAVHQAASYAGVVVGSWIAAWIGEVYGWRLTFYTFGGFGVLMAAVAVLRLRNEHSGATVTRAGRLPAEPPVQLGEVLRTILRTPTLYFLSAAFAGMIFVAVGYLTWMPTFLYEKYHLSLSDAALYSMLYHFLFAVIGVLVGGRVSDRLAARRPTIRIEMKYLGLLFGAPFIWLMGTSSNLTTVYVALAGFGFFRGIYDSNLFAALFDVIAPRYRSSATGLMLSCGFIVGASSPILLGYVKQHLNLGIGLSSLGLVYLLSAGLIFIAKKTFFARDYHRETEPASMPH